MNWETLLSNKRLGREDTYAPSKARTEFQKDYDRIVFSNAFRRLQNKTQVMPFPSSDFVRNRLTHSLETASVGRSLGYLVGEKLFQKYENLSGKTGFNESDFASIVSAACLTHDIGNPPFGHSGEDAISEFFKEKRHNDYLKTLSPNQISDLQNFEGNAAGFRIITTTPHINSQIQGGLGLTYATLATFSKYPKTSSPDLKNSGRCSHKKYGFFDSEKHIFSKIAG